MTQGWSVFATGYHLQGQSRTDNTLADGDFRSHGFVAGIAKRLSPNLTVGVRWQSGRTHVNYHQVTSREQNVQSEGFAFDVVVNDDRVFWRSTVSAARNKFSAVYDPFTAGDWNGKEFGFDTQVNVNLPAPFFILSPYVGFRYLTLTQEAYVTNDFFATAFAAQSRTSSQLRTGADILVPLGRKNEFQATINGGVGVRVEADKHAPIAAFADLTGMAGNSFSFDYATAEPTRFPGMLTYTGHVGLEVRAANTIHLFVDIAAYSNQMLYWQAIQGGARFVF